MATTRMHSVEHENVAQTRNACVFLSATLQLSNKVQSYTGSRVEKTSGLHGVVARIVRVYFSRTRKLALPA